PVLLGVDLVAVKDFGRVGELLESLLLELPGLRQRPDLSELRRIGFVGQRPGADKMITGENVGRDRFRDLGGRLLLAAARACCQSSQNRYRDEFSHSGAPLLARAPPI